MKGIAKETKTRVIRMSLNTADMSVAVIDPVKAVTVSRKMSMSSDVTDRKKRSDVEAMTGTKMSRPILTSDECLKLLSWMPTATMAKKIIRTVLSKMVSCE